MKQTVEYEDEEVEDVPVSAVLQVKRDSRYGSVPDLDDEELADPEELERQVVAEQWGPILALPSQGKRERFQPSVDESGRVEGAFGSVDFDRVGPELDRARYKAEKLKEQLGDVLILVGIVKERLPGRAKYLVLKYLKLGIIELDDIVKEDMRSLAKLWLRARRLQNEIARLREASRVRREKRVKAWLES
jgi:hypothetical protein